MKVNEAGNMFMIDWAYEECHFAIYGKSPEKTADRDMAGKIALEMIRNLGANTTNIKIDYGTSSIYTKAGNGCSNRINQKGIQYLGWM